MEQRNTQRFQVRLSCTVTHLASLEVLEATTLDMGRSGALVALTLACALPRAGDSLRIEIPLPLNRRYGPRWLFCQGVATRVAKQGGEFVLAVRFERVEFTAKAFTPVGVSSAASTAVM